MANVYIELDSVVRIARSVAAAVAIVAGPLVENG